MWVGLFLVNDLRLFDGCLNSRGGFLGYQRVKLGCFAEFRDTRWLFASAGADEEGQHWDQESGKEAGHGFSGMTGCGEGGKGCLGVAYFVGWT